MTIRHSLATLALLAVLPAQTQVFGGLDDRKSAGIAFFNSDFSASPGWLAIEYGQGTWNDEYASMIDQVKGKAVRFGKNMWTSLDTSVDLKFGATTVKAGQYYVALACSPKGDWSLLLLDPNDVRKKRLMPHMTTQIVADGQAKTVAEIPMKLDKSEKTTEKQTIDIKADQKNIGNATLTISWGPHQLTAAFVCELAKDDAKAEKKDASDKKDGKADKQDGGAKK